MKCIFDSWRDANIIRKNLNSEQCELLQDILNNSKFIDKRPENFVWIMMIYMRIIFFLSKQTINISHLKIRY